MKRRIFTTSAPTVVMTVALLAAACSAPENVPAPAPARTTGWITAPMVQGVERTSGGLVVTGLATPMGRVVLRGAGETAYATGATAQGRFQLRVQPPAADTLFVIEATDGQNVSPAPWSLLAPHNPGAPVALLAAGAATRRLDRAGALDVIDSDGHAVIASGRAPAGTVIPVSIGGRERVPARTGADGRWSVVLDAGAATAGEIVVGETRYAWPGPGNAASGVGLVLQPAPGGWMLARDLSPRSRQVSWFPNAG